MLAHARISAFALLIALAGSAKPPQTSTSAPASTTAPADPTVAMQEDTRKMHAILDQMKQNLGFVGCTTTPVNHQFQLEIEMWQLQVDQMDRHIADMKEKK